MLEQLLNEIDAGGALQTNILAARLGTSPQLVAAMLGHLQRLGFISDYTDCSNGCGGCGLQDACSARPGVRLWQHQAK